MRRNWAKNLPVSYFSPGARLYPRKTNGVEMSVSTTGSHSKEGNPVTPTKGFKKKGHRWGWIAVGVVVLLAIVGIIVLRTHSTQPKTARSKTSEAQPSLIVSTVKAQKGDIGSYVNALGVVTPLNTVSVKSRVDGQLVKVEYEEGQMVREGDPLVEIDPAPFQATLSQTEGQLARDQALLENARLDLERYKEAFAKNAIPKQQFDTQTATVRQYEGTVKLDQGQADNARVQLAYCHITAPIAGRVGLRLVDPGNIVHASDANALVVITQLQPITVIFNIAEDYLPQIQKQLRAGKVLTLDAFDRAQTTKLASGTLATLDNQIDTTTGTLKLKALFSNSDESLFPNQFVNVRLLVDTFHDVTLIPNVAIQRNADSAFVYLLKPNQTVAAQNITIGTTDGNDSSVEGLEAGAVIAADNFNRLTDGANVTVRSTTNETRRADAQRSGKRKKTIE
jgi:multidrug efflux system membrane fusion protein